MIFDLIVAWVASGGAIGAASDLLRRRPSHTHRRARRILPWVFVAWLYIGITGLLLWEVH